MKNTRTRIKICGITRPEDARYVAGCGADAIGLVFYPDSPRNVTVAQAQNIVGALPAFVSVVGLFVNAEKATIEQVLNDVALDVLQFHGSEEASYCESFNRPYLKALQVKPKMDIKQAIALYPNAQGILLDAWHKTLAGGTGEAFDWDLLKGLEQNNRIILAGGLKPANVAEAIKQVKPYAVDVSSGVESAPGVKEADKIKQFINEVIRA